MLRFSGAMDLIAQLHVASRHPRRRSHGANNLPRSEGCHEDVAARGAAAHEGGPNTTPPREVTVLRDWPVGCHIGAARLRNNGYQYPTWCHKTWQWTILYKRSFWYWKITYIWFIFHWHVWLPEGKWAIDSILWYHLQSGKRFHDYGKAPCLWKYSVYMAMFNYVSLSKGTVISSNILP